ncbi:acyltransferase [Kineosporia sp. J2-2]|uniref:Acyltransferase n=1 Tax=Kineosporia corallincola TaxID=2835133 RepID=A0ABS5TF41_9ACTN|nr:acyltransferase [Kineosporia corallincola]MBT0769696.1 acyltransferase [Kineosporia corallincola]
MTASDIASDTYDRTLKPISEAPLESGIPDRPGTGGTTPAPAVPHRFTALDGLRGLAAVVVVIFHLRREFRDLGVPDAVDRMITGGYLMVDLFFVLSGFVLARTMLRTRGGRDALLFAQLRVRRFMPLHLTGWVIALSGVAFVALCQGMTLFHPRATPAFAADDTTAWAWLSSALLLQGFTGPQFAGYPAAWSLSIELWTNVLLVAVIAVLPSAALRRRVGPAALLAGAVLLTLTPAEAENSVGTVAFARGLAGLGAGVVTYELYLLFSRREPAHEAGGTVRWAAPVGMVSLLLLGLACWEREIVRDLRFLPVLPVAMLLVLSLALPSGGPAQWLLNTAVVRWLGSRSFAVYALHGPVLMTVGLGPELAGLDPDAPRVAGFVVVTGLLVTLVAAGIGHRYVERAWAPRRAAHRQVTHPQVAGKQTAGQQVAGRQVPEQRRVRA